MAAQTLLDMINQLTPEEQASVEQFVRFLQQKDPGLSFSAAAAEFVEQHPELLSRLAQ